MGLVVEVSLQGWARSLRCSVWCWHRDASGAAFPNPVSEREKPSSSSSSSTSPCLLHPLLPSLQLSDALIRKECDRGSPPSSSTTFSYRDTRSGPAPVSLDGEKRLKKGERRSCSLPSSSFCPLLHQKKTPGKKCLRSFAIRASAAALPHSPVRIPQNASCMRPFFLSLLFNSCRWRISYAHYCGSAEGIYFHTDDPVAERRSRELVSVCGSELMLRAAFRDLRCYNQRCQSSSALLNSNWDLWPENLVQLWKAAVIMWWLCPTVDLRVPAAPSFSWMQECKRKQ